MREQVLAHAEIIEKKKKGPVFAEYGELFRWMASNHFAFLGYCELTVSIRGGKVSPKIDKSSLLGVLKSADATGSESVMAILPPIVFSKTAPIVFTMTRKQSSIHRSKYMDCFLFDHDYGSSKKIRRVSCFMGLLAGSTAALPTSEIPHIRKKADYVLQSSTLREGGHAYKELRNILETLPREKLFQMDMKSLYTLSMTLLNQERRKTRLHLHRNTCGHFYYCLVYIPRDLFNSQLRKSIQDFLQEALQATEVEFDVYFSTSILTRIHYTFHTNPDLKISVDQKELEKSVQQIARDWNENLFEHLNIHAGRDAAISVLNRFRNGFSPAYEYDFTVDNAVTDIEIIEQLEGDEINAVLSLSGRYAKVDPHYASFKLYCRDTPFALSPLLPILENMGVRTLGGRPYKIRSTDGVLYRLLEINIVRHDGQKFNFDENARIFETTFIQCWNGAIENDGFNQLTLLAGLSWRRINLLRAYYRYLKQIRLRYSENYIIDALTRNPKLVVAISNLFAARFDPRKNNNGIKKYNSEVKRRLNAVSTLDEERIIKALLDVGEATLRTNYFQPRGDNSPKSYISFKLRSKSIPRIPQPAPEFEIFVYSPRVEGVHLRGGPVARGGLRWSERPEDFRTEVLGLVKAQRVKNAVIVPVGSKGGFVAKQLPEGSQDEILNEVIACYRIFISSLLDITDNLSGNRIIPPKNVVRIDGDDPYLVVAADKGTATFSDIANGISEDYGFWLGDAFASGGSAGYDHKKMGITARGAWESVKRHFRELGKNIQSEPFTVAGIGDMAGDVFGNGMLLSKQIKLVAAFNHRHIFIDPDPDPASSYKERQRLFKLPRSAWTDYDSKLISRGGGIYSRDEKSIKLSPQAKNALGASKDAYAPTDLINVILKSEVELLWNGGIGTYVKSSSETQDQAQDRNNDSLRVDATELRCKVIGEGGNLGMTQLGRIEYCDHGGLCYTDAIDNSAGVDTSDHEVNIKILLNAELRKGRLDLKSRNAILAKMEKEIATLVLYNNYMQSQVLSIEASYGDQLMPSHINAILQLEQQELLDRELEFLPHHSIMKERQELGKHLLRPELAVLLSYSKMDLYQSLLESDLPDDNYLNTEIEQYFPELMTQKYLRQVRSHRLKREIISTQITNDLVGTMGPTFHLRIANLTDSSGSDITAAYVAAREILQNDALTREIQALDNKVDACVQMDCLVNTASTLEDSILWLLRNMNQPVDMKRTVNYFSKGYRELVRNLNRITGSAHDSHHQKELADLKKKGLPNRVAGAIAARMALRNGLDIIDLSIRSRNPVNLTAEVYFSASGVLELDWLQQAISDLEARNIWHERSRFSLASDLRGHQTSIASGILESASGSTSAQKIEYWSGKNSAVLENLSHMMKNLKEESMLDFSMLSVVVSELSRLK
jgi:glutamate dehydrogenase